ncbi:MAG: hypothetical protein CMM50_09660 [Rhodospirillaceae bacterium]|nr:hypothetical protein [Rhodospirillaceae bacterium]
MAAATYCQPEPFGGVDPPDSVPFEDAISAVQGSCEAGDTLILFLPREPANMDILQDPELIAGHLCDFSEQILFGSYSKEKRWKILLCTYDGPKSRR